MQSQKILFVTLFKLIEDGLAFLFFYLMVIYYKPSAIGNVRFAISFVAVFSFIFNLRFNIAHLKYYPETDDKAACIGTLMFYKILFCSSSLIFYFALLNFLEINIIILTIIIIFLFEQITQSINNGLINILVADNEIIKGSFPWVLNIFIKIFLIITSFYYFNTNEITLASIYLISTLSNTVLLLLYCKSYNIAKPTKDLLIKYMKYTYPLTFSTIAVYVSQNIGILLINYWISPEAVAYYYAGEHLSVFRTVIPNIINLVMISIFSRNIANNNIEKNKDIIKKISRYSCILFGGIMLLCFLYSDEFIILLIGDVYRDSIFIFNVLILSHIIVINDTAVYTDLNARGYTKLFSLINIIGEVYNIILTYIFIAPNGLNLGINGVALAILFKNATYSPIIRFLLWKKYNYGYNFGIFQYLLAILIVYFLNFLPIFNLNFLKFFYLIPLFILINLALYFGILYIIRGIKRDDIKYFKLILNIKNLINLLYQDLSVKNNKSIIKDNQ